MEEKNISIRKDNGRIYLNEEEVDILSIFSYNKGDSKELTLYKRMLYTNDMDRYILDIMYSLRELATKDNREEFKKVNESLTLLFDQFIDAITERFEERQEATRISISLENKEE